ncbi:MAG: leucine-rich repeat domain-containing protein, partial [Treponema sp.]|nr:leucine-rich repeat domain-containing protein [Treponema sp.]
IVTDANPEADNAEFNVIKAALRGAPKKYVFLDFSQSPITRIPDNAFSSVEGEGSEKEKWSGCNSLAEVKLPDAITLIPRNAFRSCENLITVNIPEGVTHLYWLAFHKCSRLSRITLPNSLTYIDWNVFMDTGLTKISLPDSLTKMEGYVFAGCKLTSIHIGSGLTELGSGVFGWSGTFTSVTIPANITKLGDGAFSWNNLTSITIEGIIPADDFHPNAFFNQGDIRAKYLAGGPGKYTRPGGITWSKSH